MRRPGARKLVQNYANSLSGLGKQADKMKEIADIFAQQREIYRQIGDVGKNIGAIADKTEQRYNKKVK